MTRDATTDTRPPLTRERVLRAALRIADEDGFEALTMRRLGRALGVQAMSLYNHVGGKDDVRDGIVELVLAEVEVPEPGEDWRSAVRGTAISAHDVLLRHPWAARLMMQTSGVSTARLRWMEALLRSLREAGFSAELTHHAYHALDSHITGFTLWETSFPFESHEELVSLARSFRNSLPADEFPYVAEHVDWHIHETGPDDPSEFVFGLDLVLDGLERMRDAAADGERPPV